MSEENEFIQSLPEEYREEPSLQSYKDVGGLIKSHLELNKMMGRPRVDLPQDSWGDEDYDKFYNKLGRPEKPEGYTSELQMPEGVELNEDESKWASELLHKHGVSRKAGQEVIKAYVERQVEQNQAAETAQQQTAAETEAALKAEWGGDYEANMELVKGVAAKFGDDEFSELLQNPAIGNNPALIKFIANVGDEFREDVASGTPGAPAVSQKSRARMELDQMKSDPEKFRIMWSEDHKLNESEKIQKKNLHALRVNLMKMANA